MALIRLELNGAPLHLILHEVEVDAAGRAEQVLSDGADQLDRLLAACEVDGRTVIEAAGRHWVVVAEPYQR